MLQTHFLMDFPTDMLYKEIQLLCGIKLKVVADSLETHIAVPSACWFLYLYLALELFLQCSSHSWH